MDTVTSTTGKTSRVGKRPIDLPKGVSASVSGQSIEINHGRI